MGKGNWVSSRDGAFGEPATSVQATERPQIDTYRLNIPNMKFTTFQALAWCSKRFQFQSILDVGFSDYAGSIGKVYANAKNKKNLNYFWSQAFQSVKGKKGLTLLFIYLVTSLHQSLSRVRPSSSEVPSHVREFYNEFFSWAWPLNISCNTTATYKKMQQKTPKMAEKPPQDLEECI